MLSPFILFALAAPAAATPPQTPLPPALPIRELFQGPMPVSDKVLPPRHANSDERMFPDIAIGEMKVDGDTLYVRVLNKGASSTPGPVLVAARAEENRSQTALVAQHTAHMLPR